MSQLRTAAEDYLAIRRALGFKLGMQGRLLIQFVDHLERCGLETVTTEAAIVWATAPTGASAVWHGMRFGVVRRFAAHLQLLDPRCEVPPPDVLPERHRRLPPHIYSSEEIAALMTQARRLRPPLRAATTETLRAGASLSEVAQLLRHATVRTSARYALPDPAAVAALAKSWPEVTR